MGTKLSSIEQSEISQYIQDLAPIIAKLNNGVKYADIMKDMLSLVPDNVDRREGSVMFYALAPNAYMIARQAYMLGDFVAVQLFVDAATGEWLDRIADMFGRSREQATQSLRQINTFDTKNNPIDVPIGTRFAIEDVSFKLTERIDAGQYKAICEQYGEVGNYPRESLLPIDNIGGNFGYAQLVSDPLIPARNIESDEELRERLYLWLRSYPYGGNKADYKLKVMDIVGVGDVAVFNAAVMGAGQVGIVITDDLGGTATEELIGVVLEQIGEDGNGIAPIGHKVSVSTVTEKPINVSATLKVREGVQFDLVKEKVSTALTDFINNTDFEEDTIFISKIIATILDADIGIRDATGVTINGGSGNIVLAKTFNLFEVPVLGTVELGESEKRV